ncbi:MAG: hypothetical protein LBM75_02250, partial [Myxococcales bacterium]|nr:hypothetical protein [Myxococcales bacterium]
MSRPLNKVGFLFVAALIALVQTTCSEPESILCKFEEQEYVCPKETRCAVTQALCITEKCGDGVLDSSDGEECDDGNLIHGDGCSKDCKREYCGNGIVEINEVCDHNLGENSPVGTEDCSVDCRFNLKCGDKILDPNEDCEYIREDGTKAPDCSSNCKFIKCGNGVIDNEEHVAVALKETCDPGNEEENISAVFPENTSLSAKCLANCTIQLCGDGTVNGDEECDPGRDGLTAGCTDICTISQCGDGILNGKAGEECDCKQAEGECPDDWREWRGSPTCTNLCQDNECGDLYLGADEECDDGRLGSLRCTKTCKFNRQGDGYIGARLNEDGSYIYEQDEDGNIKTDEEGNPIVVQEECDDGVEGSQLCTPDGYRSECGDGRINPLDNRSTGWAQEDCDREGKCGEQCDPGPDRTLAGGRDIVDSTILCNRDCRISVCGDKFVNEDVDYSDSEKHEDAEECDLNTLNLQMGYDPETSPDLFFSHALTALCKKNPQPPAWDAEYYSRICNGSAVKEDDEEDSAGRRVRAVKEKYYVEYVRTYLGNTQHKAVNAIGICNGYAGGVEGFESNKCRPIRCGNGIIEYGEVCELSTTPGRFINERGEESEAIRYCSSDCRSTGICGNGIVDYAEGEICDSDDLNECSSDCKTGDLCGNGTIDQSEACDTGYDPDHPPTNKGYCVIESARNDMDWKIITYTELPSENTEDDCVRASGEWVKETSSCRLLDNCIVNNRVERCYIKTEAIECSGLGCYSGQDESLTKEDLCKANPDRDWLHICIPKSCTLASCGDGYVFNELDPSDPQGTILSGRMEECDYADAKPEEIAQGVPVNPVTGSPVSPEYQGEVKYCNYNCKFNTCGDAIISASDGEECDWGNDGSSKYHNGLTECPNGEHSCKLCTTECKLEEIGCGNGVLEGEEQCDYGKQGVSDVDHEDKCMKYPCKVCANSCDSPEATYYALVVNPPQNGTIYSTIGINCSFEGASTCSLKTTVEGPHAFTATANPGYELDTARGTAGWELQTGHSCVPSGTSLNCDSLLQNSNQALTIGVYFKSRTPVIEVSSRVGNLEMSLPLPGVTLTCKILGEETFSSCEEYQASQYYGQTLIIQKEENENVMTHYKFASWSGCTPLPDSTCSVEISRENVAPIIVYADYSANKYQVNSSIKYNSFAESAIVLCNGMPCSAALFNKDEDVAVSLDLVNSICEGATFVAMRDDVSKSANDVLYHCSCSGNKLTSCKECPDENPGTYNPSVCETPVEAIDLPSFLIAGPRTVGIEFKGIADQNITITDPGTQGTVTVKKTGAPPSNEPYLLASCGVAGAGVCQGFVSPGTPVQLSAVAATNYQLAGWFITEGPAQPVFVSNSAHTLTVTDATTIEAVFAPKLTISVKDGIEGARIGCSFPMDEEDKQYFENGAYLVKECPGSWSDNVCTISPTIDFSDCSGPYATGVVVTLTANTLAEYSNPEWVVEDGIESNPVVVEIDSPKNVMVQYDEVKSAGVRYIGRNLIEESLLECWRYGFTIDSSDYLYIEKLASCESFAAAGLANYRDKFLIKVKAGSERQVRWEAKSGRFDAYYRGSGGNQRRYQGHGYRCVSELASIFSGISTNPSSPTRKDRSSNVNRFLTTDGGGIDRYGDWSPLVDGGSVECSPGNVLYINLNSET